MAFTHRVIYRVNYNGQLQVYYNGTSEKFWWNQNAEAVCVYVPVPVGFDQNNVAFVAKSRHVSLSLDGKEASVRPKVQTSVSPLCSFGQTSPCAIL